MAESTRPAAGNHRRGAQFADDLENWEKRVAKAELTKREPEEQTEQKRIVQLKTDQRKPNLGAAEELAILKKKSGITQPSDCCVHAL
jgi:hypothetical protein